MSRGLALFASGGGGGGSGYQYLNVDDGTVVGTDYWSSSGDIITVDPIVPASTPTNLADMVTKIYWDTGYLVSDQPRIALEFEPTTFPANQSDLMTVCGIIIWSTVPFFGSSTSRNLNHHFGRGLNDGDEVGVGMEANNGNPNETGGYSSYTRTLLDTRIENDTIYQTDYVRIYNNATSHAIGNNQTKYSLNPTHKVFIFCAADHRIESSGQSPLSFKLRWAAMENPS